MDAEPISESSPSRPPLWRDPRLGWFVAAVALVLRVWTCALMPISTGDVLRLLLYGGLIERHGLWVAGYSLTSFSLQYRLIVWAGLPIGYPVGTLLFFTGVAAIWPTMFFARFALTVVEGANAYLIWRLTDRRWLGLFYWVAPMSIWWVSREAQFEPIQNLPTLLGLLLLARRPRWAMICLALAVQMKVTAILLLPWFIVEIWRRRPGQLAFCIAAFILGFAPSFIGETYYRAFEQPFLYTHPLVYNPYWWNVFDSKMFLWNPGWMIAIHQIAALASLAILLDAAFRAFRARDDIFVYLAPLAYLALIKFHTNVQFWYFLIWPALIVAIPDARRRRWLFLLWPLLDVSSLVSVFYPPLRFVQPVYMFANINSVVDYNLLHPEHLVLYAPFDPVIPLPLVGGR